MACPSAVDTPFLRRHDMLLLSLLESDSQRPSLLNLLLRTGFGGSSQFQELPEAVMICLPCVLRYFPVVLHFPLEDPVVLHRYKPFVKF